MRIAFFTDSFLPSVSGITAAITNLTHGLATAGHEVLILAPEKQAFTQNVFDKTRVRIEYLPSWPVFFNPNLRVSAPLSLRIYKAIGDFDPDIIHFHTPFLLGVSSIMASRFAKKPLVGTFHSYFMTPEYLHTAGLGRQNQLLSAALWKYAQSFYERCQVVVAPTGGVKKDLAHHIKRPECVIIPSPINESAIKKVPAGKVATLKKRYGLREKVILSVSRLSPEKSIDDLVKAFAQIAKEVPDVSLLIVGEGPERASLERLAKKLSLRDRIVFAGEVPQAQVLSQGHFQCASLFATASTSETQGLSLVEAMYFGLPLVGVAARGVGEVVGGVGLLSGPHRVAELALNLRKVLQDPKLQHHLSVKSTKEFAARYKIEKIVERYEKLYTTTIASHNV